MTPAERMQLEKDLTAAQERFKSIQFVNESMKKEIDSIERAMTDEQLDVRIPKLEEELVSLKQKLAALRTQRNSITPKAFDQVHRKVKALFKEWRKRHDCCKEVIDNILEGMETKKKASNLIEDIGITLDEVCYIIVDESSDCLLQPGMELSAWRDVER